MIGKPKINSITKYDFLSTLYEVILIFGYFLFYNCIIYVQMR